jgi:hypothetical protein
MSWDEFLPWFDMKWHPGQHIAIIGPTGQGKTTTGIQIAGLRKYVLALDAKGGDSTLEAMGWDRIPSWPPPKKIREDIEDGKPARLVVGMKARTEQEMATLVRSIRDAINAAFAEGGWTVVVDELQITAQFMALGRLVERNLIAARDRASSVMTMYQAPSWVPTASTRQATWGIVYPTRDTDVIKALAAKFGRDRRELEEALYELPDFHVLVVGLNPRMPMVLTTSPKLGG